MPTTCPKCEYIRKPTDTAPQYECPRCGVVYSKAKPKATQTLLEAISDTAPIDLREAPRAQGKKPTVELSQKQTLIAAVVIGIVVGYFLGREHIKYELRSAFTNATAGIAKGFGGANSGTPDNQKDSQTKAPDFKRLPIKATLIKKGFVEGEYGKNAITFSVEFDNTTGKEVRAFDGALIFTDLLGNEIIGAKLAVNDPVGIGQRLVWDGKLDYNQFIAKHESLRNAETQNINTVFALKRILFQDGSVKEF